MPTAESKPLPLRALVTSVGAMATPILASVIDPEWMTSPAGEIVWLTALVPAFLLAYYKGWRGASLALALGMATLTSAHVALLLTGGPEPNWPLLLAVVVVYIGTCLGLGAFADLLHRARRDAEEQALTDVLTGLPNRRQAMMVLERAFASAERGASLTVVLFDLDRFKGVNDRHGHQVGDKVLIAFAEILKNLTRRTDLSARIGGEEFLSILVYNEEEGGGIFAERVRQGLKAAELPWGPVTVSCGVAAYVPGMGASDFLVGAADRALYTAKDEGRDRVVVAGRDPEAASVLPEKIEPPSTDEARKAQHAPTSERALDDAATILIVDDDDQMRKSITEFLRDLGYNVIETNDPFAALDLLGHHDLRVDLLITDVIMPAMSGVTLVDKAAKERPGMPVLYMSGYIHGKVSWPGVPGSVTDFIEKPLSIELLTEKVEGLLDSGTILH